MHVLLTEDIEKSYGDRQILRGCNLRLEKGERVGLVGVNGAGKSTFLKIIAGEENVDHGRYEISGRMAYHSQKPILYGETVADAISDVLAWHRDLLLSYEMSLMEGDIETSSQIQDQLDSIGWSLEHNVDAMLQQLKAPPADAIVSTLSGGELRRVALAKALLANAELLILDEPTNHLDAQTIEWLEAFLKGYRGAVLLVTHDRYLLESTANRIVEIEDGVMVSYDGSYTDYLIAHTERQIRLAVAEERRLKLLAQEAAWAARSPAARSTKQKARLKRLDELQNQRRLPSERFLSIDLQHQDRLGGALMDVIDLSFQFPTMIKPLFSKLRISITPGIRLGIMGPNGCGKSTLLRCLLGDISDFTGEIRKTNRLRIGFLDQARSGLHDTETLYENAGGGNDYVKHGDNHIHVATFLQRFLFPREMLDQHVGVLSGGERARILLAKLILQGANLLVLDEPTNDLDLLTMRALEEALLDFQGGVIVVTHDRAFLDRICTDILSFEGDGVVGHYAERSQAMRQLKEIQKQQETQNSKTTPQQDTKAPTKTTNPEPQHNNPEMKKRALSFKERLELEELLTKIDELEISISNIETQMCAPDFYKSDATQITKTQEHLSNLQNNLQKLMHRWEFLSQFD